LAYGKLAAGISVDPLLDREPHLDRGHALAAVVSIRCINSFLHGAHGHADPRAGCRRTIIGSIFVWLNIGSPSPLKHGNGRATSASYVKLIAVIFSASWWSASSSRRAAAGQNAPLGGLKPNITASCRDRPSIVF